MGIVSALTSALDRASDRSVDIAERTSAATQILSSLEYLASASDRTRGGLNDWTHMQHQVPTRSPLVARLRGLIAREPVFRALHLGRIGACVVLVSPVTNNAARAAANLYLVGSTAVLYPIQLNGTDGSDQVSFLVHSAAGLGRAGGSDRTRRAASDFIGAQTTLSYVAGGLTKLPGKDWRTGTALTKIMRTETYGDSRLFRLLSTHPGIGRVGSKAALSWEISFPLLLLSRPTALVALGAGAGFHLFNAAFMGLWRFLLTFVGTYPAVWKLVRR
ncbi:hypothetical protein [Mycetocola reblochoni]|uniref:HTTM-like domain-containing protein n=2 Tax=Mycetocola reblochoni TaxID=331618 RepID=A0A1R4K7B2_9MICO|nr:hypothetical protein [Mycetocola reblochoni]RLP71105.1 hypothetical protein D9V30_01420 [Mycetocola reblochoni]SJN40179.1 hypothetical protein FM119_11830 [Mycetocola reblochoni REB411]